MEQNSEGYVPSKQFIMGRYVNENESGKELLISYLNTEVTLVWRSGRHTQVNRVKVEQSYDYTTSSGVAVEISDFLEGVEVYKNFYLRGGSGENQIEIEEFHIKESHLRPDHSSKLVGIKLLKFQTKMNKHVVEVRHKIVKQI